MKAPRRLVDVKVRREGRYAPHVLLLSDPLNPIPGVYCYLEDLKEIHRVTGNAIASIERRQSKAAARAAGDRGRRLVSVSDIARMRGCSRQRADELTREPGFPAPVPAAGRGRRWWEDEVRPYFTPRPRGRPRRPPGNQPDQPR